MQERAIKLDELKIKVGLGKTAIYQAMNEGDFPRPIRLSTQRVAWLQSEVDQWLQQRARVQVQKTPISAN